MELIDSHCHFDFDAFADDRDAVWASCRARGVAGLVIPGVSVAQWETLFALVEGQPGWYGAAGLHPWWVEELALEPDELKRRLLSRGALSSCIAVGECGLDKEISVPLDRQELIFRLQLSAACDLDLPVIVHVHKYHAEALRILKDLRPPRGGVIHAFSGSEEIAREYWQLGFHLGVGGTITYERAAKTRRAVAAAPMESLLLESDAPDMPLCGRQGQRNSPEFLPDIAAVLAELRSISVEEVALQTRQNTERLFSI
ncbi:TatD family deoxyribonuclease [Microbulbifer flavimaris]|uniref:TatD family deoxyribonuclease n=1 Tax=Microbulbifer flavimaris TaxID=1781068 RepID=A0ABX4HVZ5_9GAMM|nr:MULTISPECIES: TatD family hydrolase [Microbulbifer]KUJ80209.1 deoxyribonuclease [Microbulbifer sp. ZGT114]PCO04274.1 TatD family deoxyribonuclease [Microbulbifer flavimaris]